MPIFLERFVLPVLATSVITVILFNPFKWDLQQRISAFVLVLALAYFVGHTLTKKKLETVPAAQQQVPSTSAPSVNQSASDSTCSNVNAGKDATVNCSGLAPKNETNG